jgi:hypothetical protein
VNVLISDDVEAARDAMRPILALYVGGMGSREKNFYNGRADRHGHSVRPQDRVRDRLAVYAQAGVGTLGVSPMAFDAASRLEQLKLVAELAESAAAV